MHVPCIFVGMHEWVVSGGLQSGGEAQDHLLVFPHQRPHRVRSTLRSRTRGEFGYITFLK